MKCVGCIAAAFLALPVQVASVAAAGPAPPPPPPPPKCSYCNGPPPPPTPVPTLAPTLVPAQQLVAVHLSPTKVRRGQSTKLTVAADSGDSVTATLKYRQGKPKVYHGKVGASGTFAEVWKVPRTAPLGKAAVLVTVQAKPAAYTTAVSFTVTK